MDGNPGTLRVAIVGAGPAGFYAALELVNYGEVTCQVDMFDRLPTPFGLVRFGVAPDHQKIKTVIGVYERGVEAADTRFRFFGNVELGSDLSLDELRSRYHAVILTYGAQSDMRLGLPGEDLPGVHAAREFVAWYNGHPDFQDAKFTLAGDRAVVVGIGNVAIDVARILCRTPHELATTDITSSASHALAAGGFREVVIVARRGPLQAACTPVELRELMHMEAADLIVDGRDLDLDPVSIALQQAGEVDRQAAKNLTVLQEGALTLPGSKGKSIRLRFYSSPLEFLGSEHVTAVRIGRNTLSRTESGYVSVAPTGEEETLPTDAVFRAIGYLVTPLEGVPFDAARRRIPHESGQVLERPSGPAVPGLFVAGWAKRGPSGVIGTNKPDASETVAALLGAWREQSLPTPPEGDIVGLLDARGIRYVSYGDWKRLDGLETEAGAREGRPRVKFTDIGEMLEALASAGEGSEA